MDDDWSLKGKDIFRTIEDTWISSSNIETLRKKLIEDLNLRFGWHEHITKIINKRFGVK